VTRVSTTLVVKILIAFFAVSLLVSACSTGVTPTASKEAATPTTPDTKTLDFEIETLEGKITSVTAVRAGKPALVEFWGST